MSTIQLHGVTKSYPGSTLKAVDGLDLCIEAGQIVTLLGPSGCGKTTTLRLIAGFERPDAGAVVVGDSVVAGPRAWIPPERRGVGMVFQEHALFPHLNVERNISFNLSPARARQRTPELLALVDLAGMGHRMPHELSGGQQQRVALARALAHDPVVVLLDEPFSSLDADLRVQMREEVRSILKAASATAVLVTHDQHDAFAISDTVVVMNGGRVAQSGTPQQVYQRPANRFVAEFVGASNVLEARVGGDGIAVETALGLLPLGRHGDGSPAISSDGDQMLVSIRPEAFRLDPEGPIEATIISAVYTGSGSNLRVAVDGSRDTPLELKIHLHSPGELHAGERLRLAVEPHAAVIVAA